MKKQNALRVKRNKVLLLQGRIENQQKRIKSLEQQLELQARMFDLYLIQIIRKYGENNKIGIEIPKLALEQYKLKIEAQDTTVVIAVEDRE